MVKKLILVLVVLVGIGAYMAPKKSPEEIAAQQQKKEIAAQEKAKTDAALKAQRDEDVIRHSAIAAAKKAVVERLNDPESARFGKIVYRKNGYVCGYVNAKNQLGGYVGEREFMAAGVPAKAALYTDPGFEKSWNKNCSSG